MHDRFFLMWSPHKRHAGSTDCLRFSFVGGKRKKSRKLRSPACRAFGPNLRSTHRSKTWLVNRLTKTGYNPLNRKDSGGCLANLLNRLHKFQQVGVDLICVRGGEAMR
jgi:hypothetical protein